ncbi:phosphate-starvation-inducible PsiE family protein [Methanotrichaceae archaeon M04Ac]|uniref:Phosphate-starvation-inducible PsiE family protein n=1 Tax=Candidatus Methanocrinis alkalitolerans TaxID=3033395 RepID=A0ABT5XE95_9EURY|nr:phosphate-starvation-inducible PsiE family protein [Candidatus Methanocrinis alkalitolerans]MCR3883295.1 phosphate-starvation-inducible PsiE family protein [Methanothrix sp.]MDF0593021.1 phosphate-starvation-inducible PsiE family protein [Candidatus Methanocrinis alkalitolerans]
MMERLAKFQKAVLTVLAWLMAIVVLLATAELFYIIAKEIATPPLALLEIDELLNIFGHFLLVLIGIELLETFKIYIEENVINVQVVLLVAIIAVARKVIILDVKALPSMTLIGISMIVISLSIGYYLVKKSQQDEKACKL